MKSGVATDVGITTDSGITLGYASRGNRLLGQCVDGLIAGAPVFLIAMLSAVSPFFGLLLIPAIIWVAFYLIFADGLHGGQSLAKQWLGMRVVDVQTGKPCSYRQSFIRNILLSILGPIDWIFIFGERHQRLGDMAAGTVVVVAD
jgi:uncharacterized RDD family membrane protein YckC